MSALAVSRRGGAYPLDEVVARFDAHGLVVLKEYLLPATRERLRATFERKLEAARAAGGVATFPAYPRAEFLLGDILAIRELEELDYIFFRRDLLAAARAILRTEELVYWGDSSVQFGDGGRGFHKDNTERLDPRHDDWQGDYGLLRCGFYCQDHVRHSGGLKVRLTSHNVANHLAGRIVDVPSSYGDLVVWSMRLTHSGNNRKLRLLRSVAMHPRLESIAPRWTTAPEQARRIAAFCSIGRPSGHADAYIRKMNERAADYTPYLQRARRAEETVVLLRQRSVGFSKPHECYGELDIT